jgi:hypothetical protein
MLFDLIVSILGLYLAGILLFLTKQVLASPILTRFQIIEIGIDNPISLFFITVLLKAVGLILLLWSIIHFAVSGIYGNSNILNWAGLKFRYDWENKAALRLEENSE